MVEIPSPSGKEQSRAEYIRAEMQKLGLADIRMDDMLNVSGVRKGSGGGPTVVFAAHTDSVFPEGTPIHVRREGDTLTAPGVGDDAANLMATLEMFRALNRGGVSTKGDLIFLASSQEEVGLLAPNIGWNQAATSLICSLRLMSTQTRSGTVLSEFQCTNFSTHHPAHIPWRAVARPAPRKL